MPAKNFLNLETKEKLQIALKEHEHPDIRERVLIFLLLNEGNTQKQIAELIGCSLSKVAYWSVHGDPENLDSLKDERMKGNYRKATSEYIDLLLEVIEIEPEKYGYEFGKWTTTRLATYLEEKTGIKLSGTQVRRILQSKKYVYLWAKYSLEDKQNPAKRTLFKQKLSEYLQIAKEFPKLLQVWFWDESGFSLRVIRRKNWCKKGTRKNKRGDRRKGRVNVMGGVRYSDKKRWVDFIPTGNSINFHLVLQTFYEDLKQEWIGEGNLAEDFQEKGCKILLILDNASFHKKEEVLQKILEEMPNLIIEFLPPYSPDYNLVELVWHSTKEYIANRLFESIEKLELVLNNLLNEGELIIKWDRKLKNKGNAVNVI
jgi:transposase